MNSVRRGATVILNVLIVVPVVVAAVLQSTRTITTGEMLFWLLPAAGLVVQLVLKAWVRRGVRAAVVVFNLVSGALILFLLWWLAFSTYEPGYVRLGLVGVLFVVGWNFVEARRARSIDDPKNGPSSNDEHHG